MYTSKLYANPLKDKRIDSPTGLKGVPPQLSALCPVPEIKDKGGAEDG